MIQKKKCQSISQDLLNSSSETTGFAHAIPIENDHYELQKQVFLNSTFDIRSNTSFKKNENPNDSTSPSYRFKSTKIKNKNSTEFNKV